MKTFVIYLKVQAQNLSLIRFYSVRIPDDTCKLVSYVYKYKNIPY